MGTEIRVTETTAVEVKPERPDNWRTLLLVGAIIGVGIIFTAFILTGWRWGLFCLFLTAWEGWTLVNRYREDTISEAVWTLAKRPITVLIFGLGFGVPTGTGYFGDPTTVLRAFVIGMIFGHFFWQAVPVPQETTHTKVERLDA